MKKIGYSLLFISIIFLSLFSIITACSKKEAFPVLGVDPVNDIGVMENHSEALVRWIKKGIKDAVVINIDTHDYVRWIPEEK